MGQILSIDTATSTCGVAIHRDGQLLKEKTATKDRSHAQLLTVLIQELTEECGISLASLDAFAVGLGPGSYTGLRIGLSTAKGLCFALDKPLVTVKTLEAMAFAAAQSRPGFSHYLPMIDARRNEVYTCIGDGKGQLIEPSHARILDEEPFESLKPEDEILCFGDGAEKAESLVQSEAKIQFDPKFSVTGGMIGTLAWERFLTRDWADLAYVEPFYLKPVRITQSTKHKRILQNGAKG